MPRARRPALHSAETSFRGKGAAACVCRPRPYQVGVFLCVLLPVPCGTALLPSMWGKRRRGGSKPWFLPQPCLPLSSIPSPQRRATCAGGARQRAGAPVHAAEVAWAPPVLGVWSKRPERRRARAALCAPHGSTVWRLSLALPVRAAAVGFPAIWTSAGALPPSVRLLCRAQRMDGLSTCRHRPARNGVAAHPHTRQDLRGVSRQEGGEEHDLRDCGTLH